MTFHDFYFQLHFGRLAKMPPVGGFFADVTFQVLLFTISTRVFFDKHPPYSLQTSMVLFGIYTITAHMSPVVFTIHNFNSCILRNHIAILPPDVDGVILYIQNHRTHASGCFDNSHP